MSSKKSDTPRAPRPNSPASGRSRPASPRPRRQKRGRRAAFLSSLLGSSKGRLGLAAAIAAVTVGGVYLAGRHEGRREVTPHERLAQEQGRDGAPPALPTAPPVPPSTSPSAPAPGPAYPPEGGAPDVSGSREAPPPVVAPPVRKPPVPPRSPVVAPRPAPLPAGAHPRIVIVIDDMGLDRPRSARAVALPAGVTTSWLPYARDLPQQTAAARQAGHQLIIHIPMQPVGRADPGPGALTTDLSDEEITRRMLIDLAAFDGYVGVNNHMGSRFTADASRLDVVLRILAERGLMFLDSRTTPDSKAAALAPALHLPLVSRDVFLDDDQSPQAVQAMLNRVEEVARKHGLAVAIGHPHDVTLTALERWLPTLAAKGFVLVPLTDALPHASVEEGR